MATLTQQRLTVLAALLHYPTEGFRTLLDYAAGESDDVRAFRDETANVSADGLQELYTTTFDLNPMATLEVGWHVWGEQYERGRFLAELRELEARHGIDSQTELPDHLTVLLPLLERLDEKAAGPIRARVTFALAKIQEKLDEFACPYRHLIRAVAAAVEGERP
jgi:nitrate reductase assembly molybdenum cofactor insertion protein NarJ